MLLLFPTQRKQKTLDSTYSAPCLLLAGSLTPTMFFAHLAGLELGSVTWMTPMNGIFLVTASRLNFFRCTMMDVSNIPRPDASEE
jgi:predicted membrane channel-forming protein YqfA (hemolysin III family)